MIELFLFYEGFMIIICIIGGFSGVARLAIKGAAAKDRNPFNIQDNEQREEMEITRNQRTNFTVFAAPLCLFTWMFISFGLGLLIGITFIVCIIALVISGVDNRRNRSAVDKFINKFIFPSGLFSIEAILVMIQMMAVTVFYLIIL
ncbi:putative membrane protein [Paenibacillus polymyxa]|uniref:hypothetical protein n=1 Tax=Paenibacillus polymyxa TaxID=1406 RepID=UPI00278FD69F|nr:hypothetical protein [Paenibacillus polymyxa]MDQ0047186.1 putative membrane protein [Paenibacillus polymyxa]